ncbi:helix-turn-helix transcriptional regulator [Aquincola sp. S2]|jgi:transcriptional regulator with XRE-family HTH domain|uniref:Helix-turn-helix transcriptional regulator n=1 Tax=Pseudaquabacterium terrae TaxID=2732868 RepID=A0ABX2EU49_9BURK|nr:helix-turn-helix transcriptional regulator [Aquabacterium terrae]NRF72272.1 helix-turn-helix transcriptional regulator [Aquabacterium terrae]
MARKIKPEFAQELGSRLRGARLGLGMTLTQVAAACGGDHTRVSKIERGQFATVNTYVQAICKEVHVDPDCTDDASPQALHAKLEQLIRRKPSTAPALRAVFDALDRMAN